MVIVQLKRGVRRGSGHKSQRFTTQNHKSQSFQMPISQVTDKKNRNHREFSDLANVFAAVLTDLQHITDQLLKNNYLYERNVSFNSLFHSSL